MKRVKDDPLLVSLIEMLKKEKKPIWKKVMRELDKPRRQRAQVNLSKIDLYGSSDGVVLVPGKVLGSGSLTRGMTIAAFSFSDTAEKLITKAGGRVISIEDLHNSNPEGKSVTLLK